MPEFLFHTSKTDSTHWHFDRHPEYGEEVILGNLGVFVVGRRLQVTDPNVDAAYAIEWIRETTPKERVEVTRKPDGPFLLPPVGAARLNRVAITITRGDVVVLPWKSRDLLLDRIRRRDSDAATALVGSFTAVGASRPVPLTRDGEVLLWNEINEWSRDAGGYEEMPDGIWNLRNALADEFNDVPDPDGA